jgi:hypothetical protein
VATRAYHRWVDGGKPWKAARPLLDIGQRLREHGYIVYYLGDIDHLTDDLPEDHCPFSFTGWPGEHPYPYITAADIMPPRRGQVSRLDGLPLPSLAELGARLYRDRAANVAGMRWLKYMNWEPAGPGGPCYHDAWMPSHRRRASSDRGHIHASCRTDFVDSSTARGYDPVARIRGITESEESVARLIVAKEKGSPEVYVGDGITRRHVATMDDVENLLWWMRNRLGYPAEHARLHEFDPGTLPGVLGVLVDAPAPDTDPDTPPTA